MHPHVVMSKQPCDLGVLMTQILTTLILTSCYASLAIPQIITALRLFSKIKRHVHTMLSSLLIHKGVHTHRKTIQLSIATQQHDVLMPPDTTME